MQTAGLAGENSKPGAFPFLNALFLIVRRGKARLYSGSQPNPATFAPADSNRSGHGGNEMAEAFDVDHIRPTCRRINGEQIVVTLSRQIELFPFPRTISAETRRNNVKYKLHYFQQ
jgi:hypothetical protein